MAKKWVAVVKGSEDEVAVSADRSSGRLQLSFGEARVDVDARVLADGTLSVLVGNQSFVVNLARGRSDTIHALVGGANVELVLEDAARRSLASATGDARRKSGEVVVAPIAGKVVDVVIEVGETVAAGSRLAVLEAMKMENEIRASSDGVVSAVHVGVGDSVETNQKLVTLKSA